MRRYLTLCMMWAAVAAVFGVADGQTVPSDSATLNERLLNDLDRELIVKPPTPPAATEPKNVGSRAIESDVAGEDLAGVSQSDALNAIERQMREVQQRIKQYDVAVETQRMQAQIIKQIDALLQASGRNAGQLSQQSPGNQSLSPDNESGDASAAASDSTNRLSSHGATPMNRQTLETWLKKTWGHLPARLRAPMLDSGVEDFLPQYQTLIEDYYRRLAEDQSDDY